MKILPAATSNSPCGERRQMGCVSKGGDRGLRGRMRTRTGPRDRRPRSWWVLYLPRPLAASCLPLQALPLGLLEALPLIPGVTPPLASYSAPRPSHRPQVPGALTAPPFLPGGSLLSPSRSLPSSPVRLRLSRVAPPLPPPAAHLQSPSAPAPAPALSRLSLPKFLFHSATAELTFLAGNNPPRALVSLSVTAEPSFLLPLGGSSGVLCGDSSWGLCCPGQPQVCPVLLPDGCWGCKLEPNFRPICPKAFSPRPGRRASSSDPMPSFV